MLTIGFYRSGIQAFLKAKVDAEKKAKEEGGGDQLTVEELRSQNIQLEEDNKKLQEEVDALRILIEDDDSGGSRVRMLMC